MQKKLIVIITLLAFGSPLQAADLKSKSETRALADELTNQFLMENFKSSFDEAKNYWPLPKIEIDGLVNQIKQQWPIVQQRFGKGVGIEFVREEKIGNSFLRYYYLHKFENHAIYWRFDFYKPRKTWKINSIVFLDKLETLYQ